MNNVMDNVRLADNDMEFIYCEIKSRIMKYRIIKELNGSSDAEVKKIGEYLKKNPISVFPYEYKKKYNINEHIAEKDNESGLIYVRHNGMKMYMRRKYTSLFRAKRYYNNILMEQDNESPHCYVSEKFEPDEGSVIIDIGGAEGFFGLKYIEKVKKIFIFECDSEWVEALEKTYEAYKDKVVIIEKFVGKYTDEKNVSLDDFIKENHLENERIFVKIDAEGSEPLILYGAKNLISSAQNVKMAVCTYHCAEHEKLVRNVFKGWNIECSKGYMLYYYDLNFNKPYIRRGVLRIQN